MQVKDLTPSIHDMLRGEELWNGLFIVLLTFLSMETVGTWRVLGAAFDPTGGEGKIRKPSGNSPAMYGKNSQLVYTVGILGPDGHVWELGDTHQNPCLWDRTGICS